MKNIPFRTRISLTIAGLLVMAGAFYAASPASFGPVFDAQDNGPVGVAAAPGDLLITEYCSQNLDSIDCSGKLSVLGTIPPGVFECSERELAIAPALSANAGFTPRDVFIMQGAEIYKFSGGVFTLFATIAGAPDDEGGITFDHEGDFGYNMIITTYDGKVWKVDGGGTTPKTPIMIADFGVIGIRGPAVAPSTFGPYARQILVVDQWNSAVHAIASDGSVTPYAFSWYGPEAVVVIPSTPCAFCNDSANPGAYFQAVFDLGAIYKYPPADFTGLGGGILVTSEFGAGIGLITYDPVNPLADVTGYVNTSFDTSLALILEGSAWADCDVPTPTPTATPSPSPSSTPSAAATSLSVSAATGTYGGTTTFTATLTSDGNPVANETINFTLNGNFAGSGVTGANGVATSSSVLLYGGSYNAGYYPTGAAASFAANSSFGASSGTNSLTVYKAKILLTADSKSRLYGNPNPPLTASYTGFVQADTLATSGVTGQPALATTATQYSAPGKYPITITQGTLAAGNNYEITFVDGTLTVYLGGMIGLESITIAATYGLVDSFDSSIGYPASRSQDAILLSNGTIKVQGSEVDGDMVSALGNVILLPHSLVTGDVTYATTLDNRGTILGHIYHQTSPRFVAPLPDACGSYTAAPTTGSMWITGDYTYHATKGDLTVNGNGTATLANGTYCFHNVSVNGGATLRVNGPVTINVTGTFTASGNCLQNSTYIPANLQVVSSYTGNNGVSVSGGSATYLTIYAPGTSVSISGDAPLFGALVGKTLTVTGNSALHYDAALPDIFSGFEP